jgi:hypothetical protein
VAKRQLSRPTRDSFGAPGTRTPARGSSGLRSSIVNSPYSSWSAFGCVSGKCCWDTIVVGIVVSSQ